MNRRDPGGTARPRRQWPLLLVSAGVLGGVASTVIGPQTWRPGCVVIGVSVLLAGLLRLVLSDRRAGLLQVRSKGFDVAVLLFTGGAIVALALIVPGGR